MSFLEPKTVDMFYFTGKQRTTPSCPVQLAPDFNPSTASQSYVHSDAACSRNCWYVGIGLDRTSPVLSLKEHCHDNLIFILSFGQIPIYNFNKISKKNGDAFRPPRRTSHVICFSVGTSHNQFCFV